MVREKSHVSLIHTHALQRYQRTHLILYSSHSRNLLLFMSVGYIVGNVREISAQHIGQISNSIYEDELYLAHIHGRPYKCGEFVSKPGDV